MLGIIDKKLGLALTVLIFIGLFAFIKLFSSSNGDTHDHPELKSGEGLFDRHCAKCHSEDGTGLLVEQIPANIFTARGRMEIINYVTTDINPERKMPVFSTMPYPEAVAIADHLIVLKQVYEITSKEKKKLQMLIIEP